MKLNFKKTSMIVAASSVILVPNAMAEGNTTFYGHFGAEAVYSASKDKSNSTSDSTSISFREGGNRFGVRWSKDNVAGHLELGIDAIQGDGKTGSVGVRYANIKVSLPSGGTLGIGQQNNLRVSSGWLSNAWYDHASSISEDNKVNGSRYQGVSYLHDLQGKGTAGVMLGMVNTDDGSGTGAGKKKNNIIDKISAKASFQAMPELTVEASWDQFFGSEDKDQTKKRALSAAASYSKDQITGHLGFVLKSDEKGKKETKLTVISLNGAFDMGNGMTAYGGLKTTAYKQKNSAGKSVKNAEERETALSAGVNTTVWGGAAFAGLNYRANYKGVKDDKLTELVSGISYSF